MGGVLDSTPVGMNVLAGQCSSWAGGIAAATAPHVPGAGHASVVAVAAIHTRAGLGAATLSSRMIATGSTLTTTAVGFTEREAQSAAVLSELRR